MNKAPVLVICAFLTVALAIPAFAGGSDGSVAYKAGKAVYSHGSKVITNTEHHLTNGLRNVFGLFNPCLDLIKGCTHVVLYPVEKPLEMWDAASAKRPPVKKQAAADKTEQPEAEKEKETK